MLVKELLIDMFWTKCPCKYTSIIQEVGIVVLRGVNGGCYKITFRNINLIKDTNSITYFPD